MEKTSKIVKTIFFVINILLSVFALLIAFSQYLMMATHFGIMSIAAIEQGRHIVVMLFLSVCTYLVKRFKHPWISMVLSIVLSVILFLYLAIIVSIR